MTRIARSPLLAALAATSVHLLPIPALAWNPQAGDWTKSHATDIRIMTWNVEDGIRTEATKTDGLNSWTALAQIVAGIKPDVLLLQEVGDNGCLNCVDTVSELQTVFDLFFYGGNDPFTTGNPAVTAYVQLYDAGVDLPYVFVSVENDGYNRNVILSRFPFADLNGDGKSQISDVPSVSPHLYAPGGDGGIRGFQFAEIDLTNVTYVGDLVVGNAHLKAGGSSSDLADREEAARNVAYVVDYWFNGAGTGNPDPSGKIFDSPAATSILPPNTPVVLGGDWNEDELTNGRRGPAAWLTEAQLAGSTDGTDRDRSDSTYDSATDIFSGSRATQSSSKLDYLAVQDSIATIRRMFLFNASDTPSQSLPPEVLGFRFPSQVSTVASDHRPVIIDLIVPQGSGCQNNQDCNDGLFCNGVETCNLGTNTCEPGTPINCTDGIACTTDFCDEATDSCDYTPNNTPCQNGQFCDGVEQCVVGVGCSSGSPPDCGELICNETNDSCAECEFAADCDDGLFCNGVETCDSFGLCNGGQPLNCSDGVACTIDACDEGSGQCTHTPDDMACGNGVFCDGDEVCDPVSGCEPGSPRDCADGVDCTVDTCEEATQSCVNTPDAALCSNGLFCDGEESCDSQLGCIAGTPPDCSDDGIACTTSDFCNENANACDGVPDDNLCGPDEICVSFFGCADGSLLPPTVPATYPAGVLKNRYVSFVPSASAVGLSHGYALTHVGTGASYFLGQPTPLSPTQAISRLVGDANPPLAMFSNYQAIHVTGCMVAPDEEYQLRATLDGVSYSVALNLFTAPAPTNGRWWADVVGDLAAGGDPGTTPPTPPNSWRPPNGQMNGFDITAVLQAFQQVPTAPHVTWVDLNPVVPDGLANAGDILQASNAFSIGTDREFYPFAHPGNCTICGPDPVASCPEPPPSQ